MNQALPNPSVTASGGPLADADPAHPPRPWWRERMMWLVLGAPAAAVVASLATVVVAYRNVDPVVTDLPGAQQVVRPNAHTPAQSARNHAATAAPR